jgi:hypothetical protein
MEDYTFFSILFINNKLVTAVFMFGIHICNQAARIRVRNYSARPHLFDISQIFKEKVNGVSSNSSDVCFMVSVEENKQKKSGR